MDKEQRDELLDLATLAHGESWCLHPNGTSVWTGEEYQADPNVGPPQYMVCKQVNPLDEIEVRRMEFIAGCNPHVVLELLEFYGLSDTRIERGVEDHDEVCVACSYATTEGHTHDECYGHGKSDGAQEENIENAVALCDALGIGYHGYSFQEAHKKAVLFRLDALMLAAALSMRSVPLSPGELAALQRIAGTVE